MEYELFIYSTYNAEYIANRLILSDESLKYEMKVYEGSRIYLGCELFSMNIEIEDISNLDFIKESYGVNVNLCIDFQVYNKTYRLGIRKMLKVIGAVLSQIQGDALLLSNGSTEVLRKEKEDLFVNNIEEFAKYPFEELGTSYKNIKS